MMSLNDTTHELAILNDVSSAGASLASGQLEFMVHRRLQADDNRGVQEPLNETMCGCNDIGADPGKMGKNGHEGDGGCDCAGLTMRGLHWIIFDTIDNAHETRRILGEGLNNPSSLAFHKPSNQIAPTRELSMASMSALSAALPPNVKLVTLTSNYESFNDGKWLLRLSHLYEAGEHPTLAVPVEVDLSKVFGNAGLKITDAEEFSLTGNRPIAEMNKNKFKWDTFFPNQAVKKQMEAHKALAFEEKVPFQYPVVTIRPMEVRTFMASFV